MKANNEDQHSREISSRRGETAVIDPSCNSAPIAVRRFLQVLASLVSVCLLVEAYCRWILHLGYPYDWPLMFPHPSFWDFKAYFDQFQRLHTASFFEGPDVMMYPPSLVVCYRFFYQFQPFAAVVFVGFILITSLAAAILTARAFIKLDMAPARAIGIVTATCLLSYPLWFETKQANMEIIVWLVVALGVLCFYKHNDWTAAALFGIAGALKFYPIIYLGLLWVRKRYMECVFGCTVAAVTLLSSLYFVGPTLRVSWQGMGYGMRLSKYGYLLVRRPHEMGFDHSLFGLIKAGLVFAHSAGFAPHVVQPFPPALLSCYLAVVGLLGIALYLFRIQRLPVANQVLCLTVASIVLPPMSFDYTLLHLYVPWALLVLLAIKAQKHRVRINGLTAILVLMAFSMAPLSELIFRQERIGGEIRALLLSALFVAGVIYPLTLSDDDDLPAQEV